MGMGHIQVQQVQRKAGNGIIWPWGIDGKVVMWAHSNMIIMLYVHMWHYME